MELVTWATLKAEIEDEMDLHNEVFVDDDEMMKYANDAIDECESEIHMLYEDYFLKKYDVPLVAGTSEYALPTDIYANKVRFIQYDDGGVNQYPITKITDLSDIALIEVGEDYRYNITNETAANGPRIIFYPPPIATDSTLVDMWYIRNANKITATTDTIDIPEFKVFIKDYIKAKLTGDKEVGNPSLQKWMRDLELSRKKMRETLGEMIPDGDSYIVPDMTFYFDMS
ncbi:MAG: hypothetical protein GY861_09595 [bacterium]|nr:hypothetical protein [bacterium]